MNRSRFLAALPLMFSVVAGPPTRAAPLRHCETIALPGVEGRIDHLALDSPGKRLFVAALGSDELVVVDLETGLVAQRIPNLPEVQGVAWESDSHRLFVATGGDGACRVFEGDTLRVVVMTPLGDDADNVRVDTVRRQVYVGFGSGALGVLDAVAGEHVAEIELPGHPESFQLEQGGPRIFVNVPTSGQVAVVDRLQRRVVSKWSLDNAESNYPMALDEADQCLFVGCRRPPCVLVYDTVDGRIVSRVPIAGDCDDLFWDATRRRLYAAGGEGFLDVLEADGSSGYVPVAHVATALGARTALFVPELGRLYLAVPHREAQGAELRVYAIEETDLAPEGGAR